MTDNRLEYEYCLNSAKDWILTETGSFTSFVDWDDFGKRPDAYQIAYSLAKHIETERNNMADTIKQRAMDWITNKYSLNIAPPVGVDKYDERMRVFKEYLNGTFEKDTLTSGASKLEKKLMIDFPSEEYICVAIVKRDLMVGPTVHVYIFGKVWIMPKQSVYPENYSDVIKTIKNNPNPKKTMYDIGVQYD